MAAAMCQEIKDMPRGLALTVGYLALEIKGGRGGGLSFMNGRYVPSDKIEDWSKVTPYRSPSRRAQETGQTSREFTERKKPRPASQQERANTPIENDRIRRANRTRLEGRISSSPTSAAPQTPAATTTPAGLSTTTTTTTSRGNTEVSGALVCQSASPKDQAIEELEELFCCPISQELMMDAVMTEDGFSYERSSIQAWFDLGESSSPCTGAPIGTKLYPNHTVRQAAQICWRVVAGGS